MADLTDIRRGLAANLAVLKVAAGFTAKGVKPIGQVSPWLLDNPTPPSVLIAGVEAEGLDYLGFGSSSISATFLVEACLGTVSDIGSQKLLSALMAADGTTSLVAALEADGRLTSRLGDDGRVTTDQDPAATSVAVQGYRGQSRIKLGNTTEVLLATWAVQVLA